MYTKTYSCSWKDRHQDLATLNEHILRWVADAGPPVVLPLQALVYPLPKGMLRMVAEKYAARLANERNAVISAVVKSESDRVDKLMQTALSTPHPADVVMTDDEDNGVQATTVDDAHHSNDTGNRMRRRHQQLRRLRLCYASLGFGSHPHGQLMRGVFAFHNRSQVEVVVFALSAHDGSVERTDIETHADHTVELEHHPDPASVMQSWRCDVAFYLDGYVQRSRADLFSRRRRGGIAPLQVACMYPGTLGNTADFDVVLADSVAAPAELAPEMFSERVLLLPYSYYVNDYRRSYAHVLQQPGKLSRELLPPKHRFRFANFNQLFKTDALLVRVWANLLRRHPSAVLWQLKNPTVGARFLAEEFCAQGVAPDQLWWSDRVSIPEHLARGVAMAHDFSDGAGLGLDTLQYNAHTTATDLLWGGTPFLTVAGGAFAGRVAASLALAHGVPGLLAHSVKEYEDVAAALSGASGTHRSSTPTTKRDMFRATAALQVKVERGGTRWNAASPAQFRWLQSQVAAGRARAPLFDTAAFVAALETRVRVAWERATGA